MNTRLLSATLATAVVTVAPTCVAISAEAADSGGQSGHGYTWAEVARWPDFTTGYWTGAGGGPAQPGGAAPRAGGPGGRGNLPFTDAFEAKVQAARGGGPGRATCEPMGVIADSGSAFYYSKDVIVIGGLSDWYNVWRRVYMDGRGHSDDDEPSYFGHSIGHWEGDTLVVDTVAIRAEAQISQGMPVGNYDTHVVERFQLTGPDTMQLQKTIENPEVFKEPYTTTRTLRRTSSEYFESYCWKDREATQDIDLKP